MLAIVLGLLLLAILIYWKIVKPYSYWSERGVRQRKPTYLLGDHAGIVLRKETVVEAMRNIYDAFPDERYVGFYQLLQPILMIRDLDLIKRITIKDFDHFVDHRQFVPEGLEPLWNNNLFSLTGNRWRHMRATLSPSFTTSKMKMLFHLISETAVNFNKYFLERSDGVMTLDFKDVSTRYTSDVIASAVLGVKCDSLKDRDNEFYTMGVQATTIFSGLSKFIKNLILLAMPKLAKFLGLSLYGAQVKSFFTHVVHESIKIREETGLVRQDMLQLLLESRKGRLTPEDNVKPTETGFAAAKETIAGSTCNNTMTELDITAQTLVFFLGGLDTVSILICFMAYELSVNPEAQRKLQREIDDTVEECQANLTYDVIATMKYMDMFISETLRKWPPASFLERVCVKPYTIEPVNSTEKPVHLKKGDLVLMPVSCLQWNPQYYPKPEVFDPERFNDENKSKINPCTYMPFGSGPRNCIGSRFALLEVKILYFHVLSKFDLVVVEKTQVPMKLRKSTFTIAAEEGFWFGLKRRS